MIGGSPPRALRFVFLPSSFFARGPLRFWAAERPKTHQTVAERCLSAFCDSRWSPKKIRPQLVPEAFPSLLETRGTLAFPVSLEHVRLLVAVVRNERTTYMGLHCRPWLAVFFYLLFTLVGTKKKKKNERERETQKKRFTPRFSFEKSLCSSLLGHSRWGLSL